MDTSKRVALTTGIILVLVFALIAFTLNGELVGIAASALLIATLGISLQTIYSMLGELSLGQSAIFGGAAYGYGVVTVNGLPVWLGIICGLVVAFVISALMGLILGRVQGAYFAVITYAISVLLGVLVSGSAFLGTSQGLLGVEGLPDIFPNQINVGTFIYCGGVFIVAVGIMYLVWRAPIGIALEVTRADRRLARSFGLNIRTIIIVALIASSFPAALAGIAFAGTGLYVGPSVFSFYYIVIPLSVAAIGGIRSLLGTLTGCLIVVAIPLILNIDPVTLQVIAGALLAFVVIALPLGINGGIATFVRFVGRRWFGRKDTAKGTLDAIGSSADTAGSDAQVLQSAATGAVERTRQSGGDRAAPPPPTERRAPSSTEALVAQGVSVSFGGNIAVEEVDLTIYAGEIVGLIGPNGAGKTTLVNAISGAVRCSGGEIALAGKELTTAPEYARARAGLGRTFQDMALVEVLTVEQSLIIAQTRGHFLRSFLRVPALSDDAREAVDLCGLQHLLKDKVAVLSNLERRILAVALALAVGPRFLLLDEPTAGLSREDRADFVSVVRSVVETRGIGVLVIEHDVEFVSELCDRIVAMASGRVVADGLAVDVLANPEVISSYLGRSWSHAGN